MSRRTPLVPLAALCLAASITLAACGGSTPKATAGQGSEQQVVNFTRCLREHGVNVPTPTAGGGPVHFSTSNPQAMEAAQKACSRYAPAAAYQKLTPQEKVARDEEVQKFAKCMREHGVNVPAPTTGANGTVHIQQAGKGGENGPNPESPLFQAAQKACHGILHAKGGGLSVSSQGPGGGGPAGPVGSKGGANGAAGTVVGG